MVYAPNANWSALADDRHQKPVYYLAIDGLTSFHFSTGPVKSAGTTKKEYMLAPRGGGVTHDPLAGTVSVADYQVELVDVDDEVTDLICTEADGAPVATLVNRKATIYAGFRELAETDYAPIASGRITGVRMTPDLTGYVLTISDNLRLIDGPIMENATSSEPTTIRGNLVNIYWSILTGTFSTSDPDFPLDFVSTYSAGVSSAPTGLGLATALLNETQLEDERDAWHADDVMEFEFDAPVNARSFLQSELFRVMQCFPSIAGDGTLGLRFHVPPLPPATAPTLDEESILSVVGWTRKFDDHLNRFDYRGDWDGSDYGSVLYDTETTEDTSDQSATGETIEYLVESQGLSTSYNAIVIATELAGRMRARYLLPPAELLLEVGFAQRALEQGDIVAVSHPSIPDLLTGARGLTDRLMTILSIATDFDRGRLRLTLLDTGLKRYGVIAPNTATATYTSASTLEQETFVYICDASGDMSDGDPGYRLI